MANPTEATIFAPATAPGRAGLAVVRISGPGAMGALRFLTGRGEFPPRRMVRARFCAAFPAEAVDSGLAVWFPAPASFTGEDVAELHVHGSAAVLTRLLQVLAALPGLRWATAGEFTRRAFAAGKLDLAEVEGLADLIAAESESQRRQALAQMDGALSRAVEDWRARAVKALALMEATIDFADDELPGDVEARARTAMAGLRAELGRFLESARVGARVREGLTVAILGAPNVGKSSLLNRLAGWEAAIVSPVAGTTRDRVAVPMAVHGMPVTLLDTAGLRDSADPVEAEGVRRARAAAGSADVRLAVFSADSWPAAADPTWDWVDESTVVAVNKADLAPVSAPAPKDCGACIAVSAKAGTGLAGLADALARAVAAQSEIASGVSAPLTRERHRAQVLAASQALDRALARPEIELAAEDLRLAVRELGRITGRVDVDEVLDAIFGEFCIGK